MGNSQAEEQKGEAVYTALNKEAIRDSHSQPSKYYTRQFTTVPGTLESKQYSKGIDVFVHVAS